MSREEARFVSAGSIGAPLAAIEQRLRALGPRTVGCELLRTGYEYPLLRALRRAVPNARVYPLNPNFGPKSTPPPEVAVSLGTDGTAPIVQRHTRHWFVAIETLPPFTIYLDADHAAERPAAKDLPEFYGWDESAGLSPPEGPYPQFDLPVVRWAREPRTVLKFQSAGGPGELLMDCRRNDGIEQAMTVLLNGSRVHQFAFGGAWRFFQHRVALQTRPGLNELVIEYANLNEPGPRRAVQFKRLQIIAPRPATRSSEESAPSPSPS